MWWRKSHISLFPSIHFICTMVLCVSLCMQIHKLLNFWLSPSSTHCWYFCMIDCALQLDKGCSVEQWIWKIPSATTRNSVQLLRYQNTRRCPEPKAYFGHVYCTLSKILRSLNILCFALHSSSTDSFLCHHLLTARVMLNLLSISESYPITMTFHITECAKVSLTIAG